MNRRLLSSPRARFLSEPFVNGYTDIEKENATFSIGNSEENEDIFFENAPEYLKMRCKLSAKSEFPDVKISAGYRTTSNGEDFLMNKKLYDGSQIAMNGMVSEVCIEFLDIQTDCKIISEELAKIAVIYRKRFKLQTVSKRIPNYPDRLNQQSGIFMTKSDAHPFAGCYFSGIKLSEIQPYLFYVGTDVRTEPYLKIISAKEAIQSNLVRISKDVDTSSLSTLEDDVCNGEVRFKANEFTYMSILSQKDTLTSDIFTILFKKIND